MMLTTIFGTIGVAYGGYAGAALGAFGGQPIRHAVIFGSIVGGLGAGGGYLLDNVVGNFDEPAPLVFTVEQQKSISECDSNAPEGMEAVIELGSDGQVNCMYKPK